MEIEQTDLLFSFNKITDCLDKGNAIALIFFKKAFDIVSFQVISQLERN